jgi:Tfp pilus assembly protein PilV
MVVNVLIALLFSLVFIVGVLLGVYAATFSSGRAEEKVQRISRQYVAQMRNIKRQREDSADWWKYRRTSDRSGVRGEWKSGSRDSPD